MTSINVKRQILIKEDVLFYINFYSLALDFIENSTAKKPYGATNSTFTLSGSSK